MFPIIILLVDSSLIHIYYISYYIVMSVPLGVFAGIDNVKFLLIYSDYNSRINYSI